MISPTSTKSKIYLKDYQSPHFEITNTKLSFQIQESQVIVSQTSVFKMKELKPILLNGVDLKLISIQIDGKDLTANDYQLDLTNLHSLELKKISDQFTLKIVTEIDPFNNKSLEGLYKSNNYLVTQCEAQGFRKITFFPDRPDVMTSYEVEIEADKNKYPTLLANGDLISTEDLPNHRHKVVWQDPWKKPCYLFALFAGDVGCLKDSFRTKSGKEVSLEIYCDHKKENRCVHAMSSLKKSMLWDEKAFNREYDLNKFMIVAIDDFNSGAMENKGLNIFNSRLLFADFKTTTDLDFFNIESVIAHEYFHNWTGNRITLRDWFQLSLKEGLTVFRDQEFSADMTEKGIQRIRDVDALKEKQFPEDAGPNAHPVRPESCYAVDNFYTATIYEKGAEVIRMMRNILGRKQFASAMENYFNTYDGQAITTDDFRRMILDNSGVNSNLFKKWYEIPGTPHLKVTESYSEKTKEFTLIFEQEKDIFHIPVFIRFFNSKGQKITLKHSHITQNSDGDELINLKEQNLSLLFSDVNEKPIVSLLRNFSAPIFLEKNTSLNDLFVLARFDDDTFNRRQAFSDIYLDIYEKVFKYCQKSPSATPSSLLELIEKENNDLLKVIKSFSSLVSSTALDDTIPALVKCKLLLFPSSQVIAQHLKMIDPKPMVTTEQLIKSQLLIDKFSECEKTLFNLKLEIEKETTANYDNTISAKRELLNNLFDLYTYGVNRDVALNTLEKIDIKFPFNQELFKFRQTLNLNSKDKKVLSIKSFFEKWQNENLVLQKWMQTIADTVSDETFSLVESIYYSDRFDAHNPNQIYSLIRTFSQNILVFHASEKHWSFVLNVIKRVDSYNPQVAARIAGGFQTSVLLPSNSKELLVTTINNFVKENKLSNNVFELLSKYSS